MKFLIFGGSGYLSWQLFQHLKKKNSCQVLSRKGKFNYNLLNKKNFVKNFDVFIHLAGPSYYNINNRNISDRKKITQKLLKNITKKQFLIYFSTNLKKSNNKKKNQYIKSHILCENLINKKKNINYKIIKLPNVYGFKYKFYKKNIKSSVINLFLYKILKNKKIKLKEPNSVRNWLSITNFLELVNKLILKKNIKIKTNKIKIRNVLKKLIYIHRKKNKFFFINHFDKQIFKTLKVIKNGA